MNSYHESIINDEVTKFLLGEGKYYRHNKDWDCHDYSSTWFEIMIYSLETMDGSAFSNLDRNIVALLKARSDAESTYVAVLYVCNYYYYTQEDKKLKENWEMSHELKVLLSQRFKGHLELEPHKEENLNWCLEKLEDYGVIPFENNPS